MGARRKTSKPDVRAALNRAAALGEAKAVLAAGGGGDEPPDADGLTPRHHQALRLRGLDRQSYEQIAATIGLSVRQTRHIVREALERLEGITKETAEEVRQLELRALDEMQSVFVPKMRDGNAAAAAILLKLQIRRDRLMGLSGDEGGSPDPDEVEVPDWVPLRPGDEEPAVDADLNAALAVSAEADDGV